MDQDVQFVIKMRDEATKTWDKIVKELMDTGSVSAKTQKELTKVARGMDEITDSGQKAGNTVRDIARQVGTLAASAGIFYKLQSEVTKSLTAFASYQQGMSEVTKSTGIAGAELNSMGGFITQLSTDIPVSGEALRGFAADAGRAGIAGKEAMESYIRAAGDMKVALADVDPGELLATINLTTTPVDRIRDIAAALDTLDDSANTSAPAIMALSTDIASASQSFKVSAEDVLAWSTTFAEARIEAGTASTTILRLGSTIQEASAKGGQSLRDMARVAGLSVTDFKKMADTDMAGAINRIIGGLKTIQETDKKGYFPTLKRFGFDGVEARKGIEPLVAAYDKLLGFQRLAKDTSITIPHLDKDVTEQLKNFNAEIELTKNKLTVLRESVGADFADVMQPLLEGIGDVLESLHTLYNDLPDGAQKFIAFGGTAVVALVGLGTALSGLGVKMLLIKTLAPQMAAAIGTATAAAAPWVLGLGLAAAAFAALYDAEKDAIDHLEALDQAHADAKEHTDNLTDATAKLQSLLADPNAATAAINAARAVVNARIKEESQTRKNIIAEIEYQRTLMQNANSQAVGGRALNAGAMGVAQSAETRGKRNIAALQGDLTNVDAALKAAKAELANVGRSTGNDPKNDPVAKVDGLSIKGDGKAKKTKLSDSERDAQNEAKARADNLRDMQIEIASYKELSATIDMSNIDRLREQAVIDATTELRKRSGNASAQLTAKEVGLIRQKVDAEYKLQQAEQAADSVADLEYESQLLDDQLRILGMTVDKRGEELAVLQAIQRAHSQGGRAATEAEKDAARAAYRKQTAVDDATASDSAIRSNQSAAAGLRAQQDNLGPDTEARRQSLALRQAEIEAMRTSRSLTEAEKVSIREATAAQWEYDQALQSYQDGVEARNAAFSAVTDAFGGFITGAKGAKQAIGDLLGSLADLALQYLIMIPIKRAFEASGGNVGAAVGAIFHSGGHVGSGSDRGRTMPASTWAGAPRLHTGGLAAGEVPAILQKTEAVAPLFRGRDGKMGVRVEGGGGGNTIQFSPTIAITVQGAEAQGDPTQLGKTLGELVEVKMSQFVAKESRPGGMLNMGSK